MSITAKKFDPPVCGADSSQLETEAMSQFDLQNTRQDQSARIDLGTLIECAESFMSDWEDDDGVDPESDAERIARRRELEAELPLARAAGDLLAALRVLLFAARDGAVLERDCAHQQAVAAIAKAIGGAG